MKKSILFCLIFVLFFNLIFAEGSENKKQFVRGNLVEKTAVVKSVTSDEAIELAIDAIDFSINNKKILGDDRELAALAVAGVFALPQKYFDSIGEDEKSEITKKLLDLFKNFEDDTVRITILNKLSVINISNENLITEFLNEINLDDAFVSRNKDFVKTVINTLGVMGNNTSFEILYELLNNESWSIYHSDLEQSLGTLAQKSTQNIIDLIKNGDVQDCRRIFDLIQKNEKNSQFFKAEIAENVLAQTIYILGTTASDDKEIISLQLDSMRVLSENKWTRASKTVITFFHTAVKQYESGLISYKEFIEVINSVTIIDPIEAVSVCSNYLVCMNQKKANGNISESDENVVLALISALGAIGDKTAFDSLLAVTYYNYSDKIITAARNALARLKW